MPLVMQGVPWADPSYLCMMDRGMWGAQPSLGASGPRAHPSSAGVAAKPGLVCQFTPFHKATVRGAPASHQLVDGDHAKDVHVTGNIP